MVVCRRQDVRLREIDNAKWPTATEEPHYLGKQQLRRLQLWLPQTDPLCTFPRVERLLARYIRSFPFSHTPSKCQLFGVFPDLLLTPESASADVCCGVVTVSGPETFCLSEDATQCHTVCFSFNLGQCLLLCLLFLSFSLFCVSSPREDVVVSPFSGPLYKLQRTTFRRAQSVTQQSAVRMIMMMMSITSTTSF